MRALSEDVKLATPLVKRLRNAGAVVQAYISLGDLQKALDVARESSSVEHWVGIVQQAAEARNNSSIESAAARVLQLTRQLTPRDARREKPA